MVSARLPASAAFPTKHFLYEKVRTIVAITDNIQFLGIKQETFTHKHNGFPHEINIDAKLSRNREFAALFSVKSDVFTSMDKAKELISSIDFDEPYNVPGHREIYNHLEQCSTSGATVSPSLVFYAARNILSPSFIVGQVPDLLNLLTTIETFRRFAVHKSDQALEWQQYYEHEKTRGDAEDVRLLAANETRALRCFLVKKDAQRREYIVLVRRLVQLYIHYLWTAPESCLLAKRLHDVFPGSFNGVDKPSDLLFHVDLSDDEKEDFGRLKLECQEWTKLVADWETKREETIQLDRENKEGSFANDFDSTFPPPYKPSVMAQDVELYMNKVEDIIWKLEAWFPSSS